jgi:hypothetical protein
VLILWNAVGLSSGFAGSCDETLCRSSPGRFALLLNDPSDITHHRKHQAPSWLGTATKSQGKTMG